MAERSFGLLESFLAHAAGAKRAHVVSCGPLSGGAVQENRLLVAELDGGQRAGRLEAVLRMDAPATIAASRPRAQEFALLKYARGRGVKVPEPLWLCEDANVLGRPFFMMAKAPGVAAGHRVVKAAESEGWGAALAAELGEELAKIHALADPRAALPFLALPEPTPAAEAVAAYRRALDAHPDPMPALEWGLRWLERNAPPAPAPVLCHRDFRTGNYLVEDGRLAAILDWEFAGLSDPDEDLGWFLARCWRFGRVEKEAGGIAPAETFLAAYERRAGRAVDRDRLVYWQAMAHARWAVIALQQAMRHRSGAEPSLELALTAHLVPELELELLRLVRDAA